MFLFVLCAIGAIALVAILGSGTNSPVPKSQSGTMEIDVPNPTVVSPERFLDFIEKTPSDQLWQVEQQLNNHDLLKDMILAKATREKSLGSSNFNVENYRKILEKVEKGNYSIEESSIPDGYSYCMTITVAGTFIKDRKEYILFELNEGDEVLLKPEPYNKHDKDAIAILHHSKIIGYVPAVECSVVRDEIRFNHIAKIADIIYKDDYIDVIVYLYRSDVTNSNPEYYLNHDTLLELRSRKIKSEYLRPKKDAEDENAFYRKKVVITGNFDYFPDRNDLAKLLYDCGADIDTAITERVSYIVAGKDAGWRKMEKVKEYDIVVFNEEQILKIFDIKK